MIPTDLEIRQALDVLDWCSEEQIQTMRGGLSRTLAAWKGSSAIGVAASPAATPAGTWVRSEIAPFYVIWMTSTEYLEGCFNR